MVITRKIEIYVCESDNEQKKNYWQTIYGWRDEVRRAANLIVSHKFVQQNVRDFSYIQEDMMERFIGENPERKTVNKKGDETIKFNVSDILKKEKGLSEQNTTYRLIASLLKGKVPADIYSSLNQLVCKSFKDDMKDVNMGNASIRSYKSNIPIPFSAKAISNIHQVTDEVVNSETGETKKVKRYYFTLFGIPFKCRLGRDRSKRDSSSNAVIIDRCISGEYKMCSSAIAFEKIVNRETGKKQQKLFLLLCVDIPSKKVELNTEKILYAYLGLAHPIQCMLGEKCDNIYTKNDRWINIDTAENFLYRRVQIQAARRRCQANCKYNKGGKGRKRKLQALDRYDEKEKNYVDTRLHQYSRELVNLAVSHGCGTICLVNQKPREDKAKEDAQKGDTFVLRNWSYFGLKQKISYKCQMEGIKLVIDGKEEIEDEIEK